MTTVPAHDPSFDFVRGHEIPNLKLNFQEYRHRTTGAMHFHMDAEHSENVFLVAFRTVPNDSTGVAHILEHTTLCGSEKYPVRDPFFLMIRRSLNSFMNAFTASDYTAYPFASENKEDFNNLLDIYLDAVFFPLLDPLDFAQEGHRLEFETADDESSNLVYRGVVYNEMKGDQSSTVSLLYEAIKAELFPTSTYHHNSGGNPADIPNLTYEQLQAFHKQHYQPGNAILMTFGDITAAEHQSKFQENALFRFDSKGSPAKVDKEIDLTTTKRVKVPYPVSASEEAKKSHVVLGWKLGPNTDLESLIKCNLLSDVLLDTSASPLRLALENTELADAPSPLCGLEETNLEMSFFCGVEGADEANADDVEHLILETLEKVSKEGVAVDKIEACLHQIELSQREIGGDGYPYGLQLMFSCLAATIHGSDPVGLLDLDPVLDRLRTEIQDPQFIPDLVKSYLLDNMHRVRLTLYPDENLSSVKDAEVRTKLDAIKASLDDQGRSNILSLSKQLTERQNREEAIDLLPKVGLKDIGPKRVAPNGVVEALPNKVPLCHFTTGTNGVAYQQVIVDLPDISSTEAPYLPILSQVITEVGSGSRDYLETQHLQHSLTGGLGCYSSIRGSLDDPMQMLGKFVLSSRSLDRNQSAMNQILGDTLYTPSLSDRSRVRDLVNQMRIRREASIANNGHGLVMTAAGAYFRPVPFYNHISNGFKGMVWLKALDKGLDNESDMDELIENLQHIHRRITEQQKQILMITDSAELNLDALNDQWPTNSSSTETLQALQGDVPQKHIPQKQVWVTSTEVNFCAEAFATVPEHHPDSAALTVLSGVLRNGFLHKAIREQGGAYGGGATHDASNGLFRFYSYRDPNLEQTLEAFSSAVEWIRTSDISFDLVEESILGIVSSIDAPGSPAGEARQSFHQALFERSIEHRTRMRQRIIETTVDDIKRVAETYLTGESSQAVLTQNPDSLVNTFTVEVI